MFEIFETAIKSIFGKANPFKRIKFSLSLSSFLSLSLSLLSLSPPYSLSLFTLSSPPYSLTFHALFSPLLSLFTLSSLPLTLSLLSPLLSHFSLSLLSPLLSHFSLSLLCPMSYPLLSVHLGICSLSINGKLSLSFNSISFLCWSGEGDIKYASTRSSLSL